MDFLGNHAHDQMSQVSRFDALESEDKVDNREIIISI
jgi:hypothetical protein